MEYKFSEEKIDSIFDMLIDYAEMNFKSVIHNEIFLEIKQLITKSLDNNNKISQFQSIGFKLATLEFIFNESISIFEFLRRNFIAHLPNSADLKQARSIDLLFSEIENYAALGYLKYEARELKNKLKVLDENIVSKDIHKMLANSLKAHISYFKDLLEIILNDDNINEITHQPCPFGIWLNEKAKEYIDDELILKDLRRMHQHFHSLVDIAESYKKDKKFKDLYFILLNLENTVVWIENNFLYINTQFIKMEMSIDPLTKALNRRSFETIMQRLLEISKITNAPISLAIADLDYFKKVNDTYGHLAGDEALRHFANITKKNLRKSDYIFRIGGEEFVILLPSTELKNAVKIIEKIRKEVESHPLHYDGKEIKITASFGLVEADPNKHINEILKEADEKLYKAKELGRNRVVTCDVRRVTGEV